MSPRVQDVATAHRNRAGAREVRARLQPLAGAGLGRLRPVVDRGQLLADEAGVGRGLVPAHSAHRQPPLAGRKLALDPGGRTGAAGGVAEALDGGIPGDGPALFLEGLEPILALLVAAGIDEGLELRVRDLVLVQPERFAQPDGGEMLEPRQVDTVGLFAAGDHDHPRRDSAFGFECDGWQRDHRPQQRAGAGDLQRAIARLLETPAQVRCGHAHPLEGCDSRDHPGIRGCVVGLVGDGGSLGLAVHARCPGDGRPQAGQHRVCGDRLLGALGEREGRDELLRFSEPRDLGQRLLARPARLARLRRQPRAEERGQQQCGGERQQDARTQQQGQRLRRSRARVRRRLQLRQQLLGRLLPGRLVLGERPRDERAQRLGQVGTQASSRPGGVSYRIACSRVAGCVPENGRRPDSSSKAITPSAQRSALASTSSPRACSGDM